MIAAVAVAVARLITEVPCQDRVTNQFVKPGLGTQPTKAIMYLQKLVYKTPTS